MEQLAGLEPAAADGPVALGRLDSFMGYLLRRAWHRVSADFEAAVAGSGIRQVTFGVLSVVAANPGVRQGAVAAILGIQRSNMVSLVTELADRGWIVRGADATDRRSVALQLTPAGAAVLNAASARLRTHEVELLKDFTTTEQAQLKTLLERLAVGG